MRFLSFLSRAFLPAALLASSSLWSQQTPSFTRNASVHDPSVIKVGDRYYVYGSHGASAWSTDLMNWTQVALNVTTGNPPHFAPFRSELSEMIAWTNANTLWAADVIQLEDGKFYYYYNVWTDFNSYRSYMGLATADTVEGPYDHVTEIMRGGTGLTGFDPRVDPNTIDPTLFWDEEDRLWMVYGSYSGGIFILEMDPTTGLPLPDQGEWGKRIAGGNHAVMEGPFIDYNPETGYYYLFLSYGGLSAADGYNMRVFRSENPDGPYVDPKGTDMTTQPVNSSLSSIAPHGLKLAGNWRFTPVDGELAQSVTGYLSPGHNSVIEDPASGKWFNIFHTRFVGRGEAHEVRVHQMFFNEDGWPVMAPHRYAGETQGSYTASEVAGSYKVLNHGMDITGDLKTSTVVGLQANGGLVGADGSWTMVDGQNIRITMGGTLYKGVVSEQWDNENRRWVLGFTAISPEGASLWGSEVAVINRDGEVAPPDLEPIEDLAIPMGETLSLPLNNRADTSELVLASTILSGPDGLQVDLDQWRITWEPLANQMGKVYDIRIQVYDVVEPDLADEVSFSLYVGGGYDVSEDRVTFESPGTGGILDSEGVATGLTARLSGTGTGYANGDPNLTLDTANGQLAIRSTESDFNGQTGVGATSAVGRKLSEFGYTGSEDFSVTARFAPITGLGSIDQVGVFVGSSATTLTRAGILQGSVAEGLGAHTQNGTDNNQTFVTTGFDLSDGLVVTIAREGGQWSYLVDGVSVAPQTPNATFLDGLNDLTVGVFAINPLNSESKTVRLNSLRVAVASDALRVTRIQEWKTTHFGENPAEGVAGNGDDPDADGRPNLLEYALGTDPMDGDEDANQAIWVEDGRLHWTFGTVGDPALSYEVMASDQLDGTGAERVWRSVAGTNQDGLVHVSEPVDSESGEARFLWLRVDSVEE